MFLVRAAFWLTAVLLVVPHEGAFGVRANATPEMVDAVRTSVLASLNRVKAELADARESRDGTLM